MIYILLGVAGSGKGTRAAILKEKLNIPHISMGDLLRDRREIDDEIGRTIRESQDAGILVKQEITDKVLLERLSADDVKGGAILDGYPRSIEQAEKLGEIFEALGVEEYKAVLLNVDIDLVKDRLLNRRTCNKCQKIFTGSEAAALEYKCDACDDGELLARSDDNVESINKRINMFFDNIGAILDYYRAKDKLQIIDSSDNPERILTVIE